MRLNLKKKKSKSCRIFLYLREPVSTSFSHTFKNLAVLFMVRVEILLRVRVPSDFDINTNYNPHRNLSKILKSVNLQTGCIKK